jgi:hypothetical protein
VNAYAALPGVVDWTPGGDYSRFMHSGFWNGDGPLRSQAKIQASPLSFGNLLTGNSPLPQGSESGLTNLLCAERDAS